MAKFEIVNKYAAGDINLPVRATAHSAGYDFEAAKDTVIPALINCWDRMRREYGNTVYMLDEMKGMTKAIETQPTLVPTGVKCKMADDEYLELCVRSSLPLKNWLVLGNGVGIVDADYYNNPDNEGEIFFQLINMNPFPLLIKKGDKIGQGIIRKYYITEDDVASGERTGGFGSTSQK